METQINKVPPEQDSLDLLPLEISESLQVSDLVSIIIPVYNAGGFMRNCLESLVNQTYKNLEIIVIDDGSKDESGEIADEYALRDERVRVLHKPNGGVSSARNEGLRLAAGDYITFVDADDWLRRDTCEKMLKAMKTADANVCFCNIVMAPVREANYLRAPKAKTGICKKKRLMQEVIRNYYPCVNNKCFKREVLFDQDGELIEFDQETRILEDGLWLMQTSKKWETGVLLKEGLSFRRLWSGSAMGNREKELENRVAFLVTFQKILPIFQETGEDLYEEAKEYFMTFALASVRKATWRSNRKWLLAIADEMCKVDERYTLYLYADIYNMISGMRKAPSMRKAAAVEENRRWNGPILRRIKKFMPYRLKEAVKKILKKCKVLD